LTPLLPLAAAGAMSKIEAASAPSERQRTALPTVAAHNSRSVSDFVDFIGVAPVRMLIVRWQAKALYNLYASILGRLHARQGANGDAAEN
jgi:hypothetical protein